jgi:ABC-type nitrate/sulfonate/bicarbonate transport system substrate-binding protein
MRTTAIVVAWIGSACLALAAGGRAAAQGQPAPQGKPPPRTLRVIAFEGGHNLPIWAAQRQGFFEENGVKVVLTFTPSSVFLVTSLFDGTQDVGVASIDNVIAYQEGQGEAKIPDHPDLAALFGGDDGFLALVTAAPVKRFEDLRGKTLSVDAMTTGFAFVLREMLHRHGLSETDVKFEKAGGTGNRFRDLMAGKHDGTLLRTPFDLLARDKGFNVLETGAGAGPYMGTVGVARRSWARENEAALVGFLAAYHRGVEWAFDKKNRDVAEALLVAHIRDMTPALARRSCDVLLASPGGLFQDMALDPARIKTVLALRSKYAQPKKALDDPSKYVEASYLHKALGPRPASPASRP